MFGLEKRRCPLVSSWGTSVVFDDSWKGMNECWIPVQILFHKNFSLIFLYFSNLWHGCLFSPHLFALPFIHAVPQRNKYEIHILTALAARYYWSPNFVFCPVFILLLFNRAVFLSNKKRIFFFCLIEELLQMFTYLCILLIKAQHCLALHSESMIKQMHQNKLRVYFRKWQPFHRYYLIFLPPFSACIFHHRVRAFCKESDFGKIPTMSSRHLA